jgi:hypothetical protein
MAQRVTTDPFEDRMRILFGGRPATLEEQFKGIDFWIDETSISVKNHLSAPRTGNYAFEIRLIRDDGFEIDGSFLTDTADVLLMSCGDGVSRFFLKHEISDILSAAPRRTVRLREGTVRDNRTQGRHFVDSRSLLVGVDEINPISFLEVHDGASEATIHQARSVLSLREF